MLWCLGIALTLADIAAVCIHASADSDEQIRQHKLEREQQGRERKQRGCVLHSGAYARGEEVYVLPEHKDVKAVSHHNERIYSEGWQCSS